MLEQKRRADRNTAQRAALEETILRAAEVEFAEKGFEGTATSAIAARAGLPKANLHYYFPTKATLYRRVLGGVLTAWLDAAAVFDHGASAEMGLRRYIEAKMDLARERPLGSRIFAREVMRGAPMVQDFLDTTLTDWVRSRCVVLEGWIASGQLRPHDPKVLLYMIWATTQHYADFAHQIATLNGGSPLDDAEFSRAKAQVADTLLGGVIAEPQ